MRYCQLVAILSCSLGVACLTAEALQGQAGAPSDSRPTAPAAAEPLIGPDAPVITMYGLCANRPPSLHLGENLSPFEEKAAPEAAGGGTASSECETTVTRSQFEDLINALNPNARADRRRRFAEDYPETALYAQQARQLGLDKTPEFQELAKFRSLEALALIYKHYMQEKAAETSDAEVEKFYKEHPERFEQFALKRVFVPKRKLHDAAHPATNPAADEAAMKKVAENIRKEAAAPGADFDVLQDKAYKAADDKESVLATDLGDKWTRDNLPAGYLKVVSTLQPGQVGEPVLFGDGWYIFKLISKRMIPPNEARAQMQGLIINDLVKTLKKSIKPEMNRAYFVTAPGSDSTPPGPQ